MAAPGHRCHPHGAMPTSMTSTPSPSRRPGRAGGRRAARLAIPPAKLEPPHLRHRVIRRERLLERLSAAVTGCRVTLVTGPPGAGKTTLLASWTSAGLSSGRLAWVSLDRHDDNPARFWSTVVTALAGAGALPDDRIVDAIASPAFPALLGELPAIACGLAARRRRADRAGARRLPRDQRPARARRHGDHPAACPASFPARARLASRPGPPSAAPSVVRPAGRGPGRRVGVHGGGDAQAAGRPRPAP